MTTTTVYALVEDKYDHYPIGVFTTPDKATTAAEKLTHNNPKKYTRRMMWVELDGRKVYTSEDERQWFEIIPTQLDAYFDGTLWVSD